MFYPHHDINRRFNGGQMRPEGQAGRNPPFLFATSLNCLSFNKSYILHAYLRVSNSE